MAGMCFVVYARPLLLLLLVLQSFLCTICVSTIYNPYIGRVSNEDEIIRMQRTNVHFCSSPKACTLHHIGWRHLSLSFQGRGDVCNGWLYGMANPLIYCCAWTLNRQQFSLINSLAVFGEYFAFVFVFGSNCNIQSRLHQFHKSWQLYCSLEDCLVKLV